MEKKRKNYDGMRYENYVVLRRDHVDEKGRWWFVCKCDCGKEFMLRNMNFGHVKSCGCLRHGKYNVKHGEGHSRLYMVWVGMKTRCFNKNVPNYSDYGGRGITVCDEWMDFETFRKWSVENGYDYNAPPHECTLDRINVNGNYEPDNCRWANALTQSNNKRNNKIVSYKGEEHTVAEWAKIKGIRIATLWRRLDSGWPVEKAMETKPSRGNKRLGIYKD